MDWRLEAFFRGMLIAVIIIVATFAFGVGKQELSRVFDFYDPLLTALIVFLLLWFGLVNLLLESWRRWKDKNSEE